MSSGLWGWVGLKLSYGVPLQMATHTLITGLEEYVRESFVSILCVFSSCLGLGG